MIIAPSVFQDPKWCNFDGILYIFSPTQWFVIINKKKLNDGEKIFTRDFTANTHYSGLIADMIRSLGIWMNELD